MRRGLCQGWGGEGPEGRSPGALAAPVGTFPFCEMGLSWGIWGGSNPVQGDGPGDSECSCTESEHVCPSRHCVGSGCVSLAVFVSCLAVGSTWMWASKCTRVCVTLCSPMCFMLLVGVGVGGGVAQGRLSGPSSPQGMRRIPRKGGLIGWGECRDPPASQAGFEVLEMRDGVGPWRSEGPALLTVAPWPGPWSADARTCQSS